MLTSLLSFLIFNVDQFDAMSAYHKREEKEFLLVCLFNRKALLEDTPQMIGSYFSEFIFKNICAS
jgi:hypothetical protein